MEQSTDTLLMVRPSNFAFNRETAASNSFQQNIASPDVNEKALVEFDRATAQFSKNNIGTIVVNDITANQTPDAIFPNNWVSFHENGMVVLYPMQAPNRRRERRNDIVERVCHQFEINNPSIIDLTHFEKSNQYLEGTGSVVFDHPNKIAYAAYSSRTHKEPFNELLKALQYSGHTFHTKSPDGIPVYHTNVLLTLGNSFAVICDAVIQDESGRNSFLEKLEHTGHRLITIDAAQMAAFAGNMLEVKNRRGDPFILLSETALLALNPSQRRTLEQFASLLPISIPVIEKVGGGSIRCMVAEVFFRNQNDMDQVIIKSATKQEELEAIFDLRWRVLRAPWNQPKGSERDDQENSSLHFMAIHRNKIVACARLQELNPGTAQLRYMAVEPEYHGKGIGKNLVNAMEATASSHGWNKIFLQARNNAVPFYESCGYSIIEKTFLLYEEIQHYSMEKTVGGGR